MLKFWGAQSIVVKDSSVANPPTYLVRQDDAEAQVFYIQPNQVSYGLDQSNKLNFLFRKYRLPAGSAKAGGGFIVFDVELAVPSSHQLDIKAQIIAIYKGLQTQLTAAQTALAKTPADTQAQQNFALATKAMNGVVNPDTIKVAPFPFKDGTVSLNIMKFADKTLVQSVVAVGMPSQDGRNTASFTAELTPEGATFFESAMSGSGGGIVTVSYIFNTWMRSSDTVIVASYNKANAEHFAQTIHDNPAGIWSSGSYSNVINEQLTKSEAVKVDITWGQGQDGTGDAAAALRKWATDAVADAVKRQIPDFVPPVDQGSAGRGDTTRTYDLSATTDFSQTYRESFAMLMQVPQDGMLPNIASMSDPNDPTGKTKLQWSDYFKEIDLADPFFQTLQLTVSTDLDFAVAPIARVVVELWYDPSADAGKPSDPSKIQHTSLAFSKSSPGPQPWHPFGTNATYSYQYTIYFTNGQTYASKKMDATTGQLVIGRSSDGLFALDVIGNGFQSKTIRQCLVALQVFDPTTKALGPGASVVISDPKSLVGKVALPLGNAFDAPYSFTYARTYTLEPDGKQLTLPTQTSTTNDAVLYVPDAFADYRAVKSILLAKPGDTAYVELVYSEGPGYERRVSPTLTSDNPTFTWIFGVLKRSSGKLTYQATYKLADGTTHDVPLTTVPGDVVTLSPAATNSLALAIDTSVIAGNWPSDLLIVEIFVTYAGKSQSQIFRKGKLPDEDHLPVKTWDIMEGSDTYSVYTIFTTTKGVRTQTKPVSYPTSEQLYLVLPSDGPAPVTA